jgi:mRNA interferase MazF
MVLKFGDVILVQITFVEINESKKRPAVVLFQELGNLVVAGITSNVK